MANAFKCDLCGKYFDKKMPQVFRVIQITPDWALNDEKDLCDECYTKLENLMKPNEEKE